MKTLTIGHIDSESTWRGGQKQVIELIRGLEARGQKNILFCQPDSKISEHAAAYGIESVFIPLRGEWDIASAWKIRKHIIEQSIDLVHTHSSHAHMIGLLALTRVSGCSLVVSRRVDFHIKSTLSRLFKYGKRVDRFITVSDAIRRVLIEDGIDPSRIVTIKSGFSPVHLKRTSAHDYRRELGIHPDTVVVVTVAALAPHKSHTDLLKAAALVVKKNKNIIFLLAGEGEMRSPLERQIINLGLEPYVKLLGFIDDIAAVFQTADIFALSSEEEGLCTSILDAMYFNLPVVATSAGGIPELVQDQMNGYIVPIHDYQSFAERLISLIEQPERRKKMGERSAQTLSQFTVENTIDKTLAEYRSLAGVEGSGK
jgi:L-malate glycosyltransferase